MGKLQSKGSWQTVRKKVKIFDPLENFLQATCTKSWCLGPQTPLALVYCNTNLYPCHQAFSFLQFTWRYCPQCGSSWTQVNAQLLQAVQVQPQHSKGHDAIFIVLSFLSQNIVRNIQRNKQHTHTQSYYVAYACTVVRSTITSRT